MRIAIAAREKEVRDLRAASRSPTPSRAPLSPGNRSMTPTRERNIDEELQMAIGGWEDVLQKRRSGGRGKSHF